MNSAITVVIVDDHPMFRSGLRSVLDAADEISVSGEAGTAAEALRAVRTERPDVVLLDLHLPDGSGIDIIRALAADLPATGVLVLSMLDDDDSLFAACQAGARGYLLKGADAAEIVAAVRMVSEGGAAFGPKVAERMLAIMTSGPATADLPFPQLTERERAILVELANGKSNAAIATRLGLAPKTVRNYVSAIFSKLHALDRTDVILRARDAGLGEQRKRS